ncbi:MAG: hypothetical protein J0H88_02405 [Sphingomonadales bacterium]|nr:hypothetical protein [Sphingomonadales bacterium]
MTVRNVPARRWLTITSRTLAVTLGAYAAAAFITMALPLLLVRVGVARLEAVVAASLGSFLFFAIFSIGAALARTPARAWWYLVAVSLPAIAATALLR